MLHSLEVAVAAFVALGIIALAVNLFPEAREVLLSPLTQVLGTALIALPFKAQRGAERSITGDYINE